MSALFVTMYRSKEFVQEFGRANIVAQNMPLGHILPNLKQNVELNARWFNCIDVGNATNQSEILTH